jgi:hypothetical protein
MSATNVRPATGEVSRRPAGEPRQEGTPVAAGRAAAARAIAGAQRFVLTAQIVKEGTGQPQRNARYEVVNRGGDVVAQGTTGHDGLLRHELPEGGQYTVRVVEVG